MRFETLCAGSIQNAKGAGSNLKRQRCWFKFETPKVLVQFKTPKVLVPI
jgi:hypothetical protein